MYMMKTIKRAINICVAAAFANIPFIFPSEQLIIGLYVVGILTVCALIYVVLELFNR